METNTKKKIGLLGCIGTGIGAIIGSGIFGSLPTVINDIGTGIVLALLATIVYTLAKTIPNVYLSSVTPASGSFFIAPTKLIHPAVGVFMAAQNLLQPVLISVFAVLFGDYFVALFPALEGYKTLISIVILLIYTGIAWQGNHTFAFVNNIMVVVLMVGYGLLYFCRYAKHRYLQTDTGRNLQSGRETDQLCGSSRCAGIFAVRWKRGFPDRR